VPAITRSTGTPISAAACASTDTARIARPKRVRITTSSSPTISTIAVPNTNSWMFDTASVPDAHRFARGHERREELRVGAEQQLPPFSSRSEMPIAVISDASRGAVRSGR
jgi:hypothetical protein